MATKSLSGYCTFKEIYCYFGLNPRTMKKKLAPLSMFLEKEGERKRLYSPEEVELIKKTLSADKSI